MKLENYLKTNNINIQDFADKLGVHNSAIYGYLSEKYRPDPEIAKKIRDITNRQVTLDDIYDN